MTTPDPADDLLAMLDAKVLDAVATVITEGVARGDTDADVIEAASRALDIALAPTVPGMARPFLPHQAAGFAYAIDALKRWSAVFIGDDMGLGKTQVMQALIAYILDTTPGQVLVIAPPVTFGGWATDLRAAFPGLTIAQCKGRKAERTCPTCGHVYDSPQACPQCGGDRAVVTLPDADILFLSEDTQVMRAWMTNGISHRTKQFVMTNIVTDAVAVVRDEIHGDKGANGKPASPTSRAKLMLAVGKTVRERNIPIIAASGSLTMNRPIEVVIPMQILGDLPLLKALAPGIRNAIGFAYRYCDVTYNGFGNVYTGANEARLPELHALLRQTVMLRRNKEDVGNLPHFAWHVVPYALNGVLTRLRRIENEFLEMLRDEKGVEAMWRAARAEAINRMRAMWEEAGAAKGQATVDYLLDADQGVGLTAGEPVIVFYVHRAALRSLRKGLSKVRIEDPSLGLDAKGKVRTRPLRVDELNGQVSGDRRQGVIDTFQAGGTDVLCAQVQAAGVGVTLTAARQAVFMQCPFSAGSLAQAAGRILRTDQISQDRAAAGIDVKYHVILATHETGEPTFDHAVFAMVEAKARITDAINSGTQITMPEEAVMLGALRQWYDSRQAALPRGAY